MKTSSLIVSSLGNIIEWYDFALFIYLGPIMARLFFPNDNPTVSAIYWLSIFALGFVCRPLGGILLGHFGDRIGRSRVLRFSMILMTIPTLGISLLPTYSQIGIAAPIALISLRLIQGICIGGEYSGIVIYLAEMSVRKHRALITSFAATGANIGLLIGVALTYFVQHYLTEAQLNQFGWRIVFFGGGLLGLIIFYLRIRLLETGSFKKLIDENIITTVPLITTLKKDRRLILKIIGLISFGGSLFYTTFTYLNSYLAQYSTLSPKQITLLQTILIACMLFLVPFFGWLCDRIGRKNMYKILCAVSLLLLWNIFHFFHGQHYFLILAGLMALTIISSMEQATTLVTVVEMVPPQTRYTTIALAYNVGYILFGGMTPLILSLSINLTHFSYMPALYLMVTTLLTLTIAVLFLKPSPDQLDGIY